MSFGLNIPRGSGQASGGCGSLVIAALITSLFVAGFLWLAFQAVEQTNPDRDHRGTQQRQHQRASDR